jgi:hypothetical protein
VAPEFDLQERIREVLVPSILVALRNLRDEAVSVTVHLTSADGYTPTMVNCTLPDGPVQEKVERMR